MAFFMCLEHTLKFIGVGDDELAGDFDDLAIQLHAAGYGVVIDIEAQVLRDFGRLVYEIVGVITDSTLPCAIRWSLKAGEYSWTS